MKWGRVEVSAGFFLFFAAVLFFDTGGLLLFAVAASILHELGHILAARAFGSRVESIRLHLFGAEMQLTDTLVVSYSAEALIHLTGPMANLVMAILTSWVGNHVNSETLLTFAGISFLIGLINLLPIRALDGGNALEAFGIAMTGRIHPALRIFETLTALLALVGIFLFLVKFGVNLSLLSLAAFLVPGRQHMTARSGKGIAVKRRGIVKRSELM